MRDDWTDKGIVTADTLAERYHIALCEYFRDLGFQVLRHSIARPQDVSAMVRGAVNDLDLCKTVRIRYEGVKVIRTLPLSAKVIFACLRLITGHRNRACQLSAPPLPFEWVDFRPMWITSLRALWNVRTWASSVPRLSTFKVIPVLWVSNLHADHAIYSPVTIFSLCGRNAGIGESIVLVGEDEKEAAFAAALSPRGSVGINHVS